MSVGCVELQRSTSGRRQGRTDGRRFLSSGAVPGHLDSARAQVERRWLAAGLRKVPLRPPWAGYVHVHVKMDLVYGLVWLLTVLLEGISGQGVYDLFSRSLEVVFQHANLNHQPKHYLGTCK
ncbi:MAM domain-containing glycosylphosphatidylinositol anchor protein 2 [Sigmodon hispidus]